MSARTRLVLSTSMEAKLAAIEALLLLIKDVDGIKKITDPIVIAGIIAPATVLNGQVIIAAPRVPLSAVATAIQSVTVESVGTNDVVYVGNATVTAANGYRLQPGATVSLDIDDLNKVNVTGTVGNVVSYIAVV